MQKGRTMSVELIIATFDNSEDKAGEVLKALKQARKEGGVFFENAAVIVRTKDDEFKVNDIEDVDTKHGAVFGAITGGVIGLLGGPVGAVVGAVAGAAAGGATAKLADYGVDNKLIEDVEQGLQPGSSALIVFVEVKSVSGAVGMLKRLGATSVSHDTMKSEVFDEWMQDQQGKD
jgi:uncharacterized membrane protein